MKLDKAIEILELNANEAGKQMPQDTLEAVLLLIEAGKECERARNGNPMLDGELLPGETED